MGLQKKRNQTNPKMMEKKEPVSAEIFAISMVDELLNARVAIKIDMVKPMPANKPAPKRCRHEVWAGRVPHLSCTVIKEAANIPRGLPINKPAMMPQLSVVLILAVMCSGKTMAVLASAKIGMMKKFTGVCNLCSIAGNFLMGIKNANTTPANVA